MIKYYLLTLSLFYTFLGFTQDYSDSKRMKAQPYMQFNYNPKCDSLDGNNAQHKICLNLEFQKIDSIMNNTFIEYLTTIQNDSIKAEIIKFQDIWVNNRRMVSSLKAKGFQGHMLSIYYINSMTFITEKRLEELEFFIEFK